MRGSRHTPRHTARRKGNFKKRAIKRENVSGSYEARMKQAIGETERVCKGIVSASPHLFHCVLSIVAK